MHSSKKHIFFLKKLYKKILKSKIKKELPIGCLIICSKTSKIISFGINNKKKFPFDHAEVLTIKKITLLKNKNYQDYHLYTSLEPCLSCTQIIKEYGIKTVFYACRSPDNGIQSRYKLENIDKIAIIPILCLENKFNNLLKSYFINKR